MWSLEMSVILSSAVSKTAGKPTHSPESGWERHSASLKQASFVGTVGAALHECGLHAREGQISSSAETVPRSVSEECQQQGPHWPKVECSN